MNIDLKKTERTDAETFDHLTTVLYIIFSSANDAIRLYTENDKEWNKAHKKEKRYYIDAKKYLYKYIIELINQNKNK